MVTISIRFVSGTYHATPWGNHVNEGQVEWPPSPWRLLRAFIAVYYTKVSNDENGPVIKSLIDKLAGQDPLYRLPPTSAGHTRHYHPGASYIVFDSFLVVGRDDPLIVQWPDVLLDSSELELFDKILAGLSYLGRSESWAVAQRAEDYSQPLNCYPAVRAEQGSDTVVQAPMAPRDYLIWREGFMEAAEHHAALTARNAAAVPLTLWDALTMDTNLLSKEKWSRPPGTRSIRYVTEDGPELPTQIPKTPTGYSLGAPTLARYVIAGNPRPSIRDAVLMGDILRKALMKRYPGSGSPPVELSGHTGNEPSKGHQHGYFLSEDADGDGYIDHMLVYIPMGISPEVTQALGAVHELFRYKSGFKWAVLLEGLGTVKDFEKITDLVKSSRVWTSVTPYLHPWHTKKHGKFGAGEQLQKELSLLGRFSEPANLLSLKTVRVVSQTLMSVQFRRARDADRMGPDTAGSFWQITFAEPTAGPIGLGFESHYGLGLFHAEE